MIGTGNTTGDVAETSGDVRKHLRKSLKTLAETCFRKRPETPETPSQVIENITVTETETPPLLRSVRARAHTHTPTRSKNHANWRTK